MRKILTCFSIDEHVPYNSTIKYLQYPISVGVFSLDCELSRSWKAICMKLL